MRQSKKNGAGFTFLELLISISIIFLLATIAMPVYQTMRENVILNNETEQIVKDLRLVQNLAIVSQDNTKHGIHFINGTRSYILFGGDGWETKTYTKDRERSLGIEITPSVNSDQIFTRLTGTTTAQTIAIELSGKTKNITVTANGGIFSD